jgi:hypothetical protein
MDSRIEKFISDIDKLRDLETSKSAVEAIRSDLNTIMTSGKCREFIYTNNIDKLPFGCIVHPTFSDFDINAFFIGGESCKIGEYKCEIDSKMFDYDLTNEEVAQIILFNAYHMTADTAPADVVRDHIDQFFAKENTQLIIRDSVQYKAILSFGLADALSKVTSCFSLPDDVEADAYLNSLGFAEGSFKAGIDKLYQEMPGCENEVSRQVNLSMLDWSLRLYCSVDTERPAAIHLLSKCKEVTASILYIKKMDGVISALNRIDTDAYITEAVNQIFMESKKNGGFLGYLKYSGLRDVENDLYEFQVRAKNAESEQDVMYALKQINARLTILADYIRENRNDPDIDHWIAVKEEYEDLRMILAKKNLHKRAYGIFVDYDALDNYEEF